MDAAHVYNCRLLNRTPTTVTVSLPGEGTVIFQVLHVLPFDSTRKRMSVLLRNPNSGERKLFCKGADSAMVPRLCRPQSLEEEALLEHEERMVRETALVTLLHCLDCRAAASTTSQYYLQLMSRVRPHVDPGPGRKWEFDIREPWLFLESLLERTAAAANTSRSSSATEPDTEEGEGGPGLLLRFLVTVLERDLAGWRHEHVESDSLTTEWRPLVAHVLFPSITTSLWDKRLDRLCCLYSQAPCPALRSLVSLAAQLLSARERRTASNEGKLRLASCLAQHLATAELDTERLGAELYLLQPSWLPALVTSALLSRLTGQQEGEVPGHGGGVVLGRGQQLLAGGEAGTVPETEAEIVAELLARSHGEGQLDTAHDDLVGGLEPDGGLVHDVGEDLQEVRQDGAGGGVVLTSSGGVVLLVGLPHARVEGGPRGNTHIVPVPRPQQQRVSRCHVLMAEDLPGVLHRHQPHLALFLLDVRRHDGLDKLQVVRLDLPEGRGHQPQGLLHGHLGVPDRKSVV